ncbi:MAG: hypothetical protein ACRD11_14170 [Terriglobia bacterium]
MLTFHNIIAGCEGGDAAAWRAFVIGYTPVIQRLTAVYLPTANNPDELWKDTLRAVSGDHFALLRGFDHQSEREFLVGLRAFYFDKCSSLLDPSLDTRSFPEPSIEGMASLMKGVPLVHQEVLFLKLAGYSGATLEKIFRITPAVAQSSLERLKETYSKALGNETDHGLLPAAWLKLLRGLHTAQSEACPPLRLFVRIQDGQIGWNEKDPAESHIAGCLHCLERWTALRELGYWRQAVEPKSQAGVEEFLSVLPVHDTAKKSKPLFKRIFG